MLAQGILTWFLTTQKLSPKKSLTPHICTIIKFFRSLFDPLITSIRSIIFQNGAKHMHFSQEAI